MFLQLDKLVTAVWFLKNRPELETVNKYQAAENLWSAINIANVAGATSSEGFLVFFSNFYLHDTS